MYTVALIMAFLTVLVFGVLVSMVTAHCPETEVGLKKWSDSKNTWNGSVNITLIIFFTFIQFYVCLFDGV